MAKSVYSYKVRHYECDGLGHLYIGSYLRYIHETAARASVEEGYDPTRFASIKRIWLPRRTQIDMLQPLYFGDMIEVKTEVIAVRPDNITRVYEFGKPDSDKLNAVANTDFIYLNRETMQSAAIPPEIAAGLAVASASEVPAWHKPFPSLSIRPSGSVTQRRRVGWRDVAPEQIIYNAAYLDYMVDCAMQAGITYGWTMAAGQEEGYVFIARRQWIDYLAPAGLQDELEVATWISEVKRSTVMRHYTINRVADGKPMAQGHTLFMTIDLETGRPVRMPPTFKERFASHISE